MTRDELEALRGKLIEALHFAGFQSAARVVQLHGWPLLWWTALNKLADTTNTNPTHQKLAARCQAARALLVELAGEYGLKFVVDEDTNVTRMEGVAGETNVLTGPFDLGFEHYEHLTDWLGDTPWGVLQALAKEYENDAKRCEENGETIGPKIYRRRAVWMRTAADWMKTEVELIALG